MQVLAGIHALESIQCGAVGWVSVPGNVLSEPSARVWTAFVRGDLADAQAASDALWDIMELEDRTGKYVQIYKRALEFMGRPAGPPRAPRLRLSGADEAELKAILLRAGLCTG